MSGYMAGDIGKSRREERRTEMRLDGYRRVILAVALVLVLIFSAVLYAGCGTSGAGGSGGYTEVVLDQWDGLEGDAEDLVEAAQEIKDEADLEDYSELLADAEDDVGSSEDELSDLDIPPELDESGEALEDFLSAYGDYLKALRKYLDAAIAGEVLDYTPDLDTPAVEAEEALEEYQDSQDYNPAKLDRDLWDLPGLLGEAIVNVYGDVIIDDFDDGLDDDDITEGGFNFADGAVDAWYDYFNAGDGDAMYGILDIESPIAQDLSYESIVTFVGEAYGSGLQANYSVDDIEENITELGEWATFYLTVDYSESLGMEDEVIPAYSGSVVIETVNRGDGWYVYNVTSDSAIW